jgi:hypothetical protein
LRRPKNTEVSFDRGSATSRRCSADKSVAIDGCCQTPWPYPSMGLVPLQGPIHENLLPGYRKLTTTEAAVTPFRNPQSNHLTIVFLKDDPSTGYPSFEAKYRSAEQ